MKIIHKNQTSEFKNGECCIAIEYPFDDKDINGAIIKINGRYPDSGRVANSICKELVYITKGTGKIVMNGVENEFAEGDAVFINANEEYYWEGNFEMFSACAPAWFPEQHKIIK